MESLFVQATTDKLVYRIKKLQPDSRPLWGKMNVGQMLAHCQMPLKIAVKDIKPKRSFVGMLFGSIVRKRVLNEKPFAKNLPTDKTFVFTDQRNVEEESQKLIELIQRFNTVGPEGITKDPHPFFGSMTPDEWSLLTYKHTDHHLRQFNV